MNKWKQFKLFLQEIIIRCLDIEIWQDIKNYEGHYKISNFGRVVSFKKRTNNEYYKKDRFLKFDESKLGYLRVKLCKNGIEKRFLVHRLVLETFIGESELESNHKDGIKSNNKVKNLEWVTSSENKKHAFRTGLRKPTKYTGWYRGQYDMPVKQIDFNTHKTINIFKSINEASRKLKINHANIISVIKGKRNHAGGFIWEKI